MHSAASLKLDLELSVEVDEAGPVRQELSDLIWGCAFFKPLAQRITFLASYRLAPFNLGYGTLKCGHYEHKVSMVHFEDLLF